MPTIKVSADSTCDLSPEILHELDISVSPLSIVYDNKSFKDGVEITPDEVFRLVDEQDILCSTAAVNIFEYRELFENMLQSADELIHVCLSSDMSTCYQNACTASEEFGGRVHVIDSRSLSTGIGHIVVKAAHMAKNTGMDGMQIAQCLRDLTARVDVSFIINTLGYLKRGGRCSALKAFGAAVLHLKPCIEVVDGKMTVQGTYKGSLERALKRYVKERLSRNDIEQDLIFITHSGCSPEIIAMVRKEVEANANFDNIVETRAGCTISCHCGPNALGILFIRK